MEKIKFLIFERPYYFPKNQVCTEKWPYIGLGAKHGKRKITLIPSTLKFQEERYLSLSQVCPRGFDSAIF